MLPPKYQSQPFTVSYPVTHCRYRLNLEVVVFAAGPVCQRRHPSKLSVEKVQNEGGVDHALLEHPQEIVVLLGETLGQGQRLLQVLLQRTIQRILPGAV